MFSRLTHADPARLHLILMLVLTFSTGVIDAVGFLGLDRVFTGNMTGNVVILGMALVGADDLPVLGPLRGLGILLGHVDAITPFRRRSQSEELLRLEVIRKPAFAIASLRSSRRRGRYDFMSGGAKMSAAVDTLSKDKFDGEVGGDMDAQKMACRGEKIIGLGTTSLKPGSCRRLQPLG